MTSPYFPGENAMGQDYVQAACEHEFAGAAIEGGDSECSCVRCGWVQNPGGKMREEPKPFDAQGNQVRKPTPAEAGGFFGPPPHEDVPTFMPEPEYEAALAGQTFPPETQPVIDEFVKCNETIIALEKTVESQRLMIEQLDARIAVLISEEKANSRAMSVAGEVIREQKLELEELRGRMKTIGVVNDLALRVLEMAKR